MIKEYKLFSRFTRLFASLKNVNWYAKRFWYILINLLWINQSIQILGSNLCCKCQNWSISFLRHFFIDLPLFLLITDLKVNLFYLKKHFTCIQLFQNNSR